MRQTPAQLYRTFAFKLLGPMVLAFAVIILLGPAHAQDVMSQDAAAGFWNSVGLGFMTELLPGWVLLTLFAAYKVLELVGKLIPNDATGVLGFLRKAGKFLSGYVNNRQTAGDKIA